MIYRRLSKRQKLAMLWWQQPRFRGRDVLLCDGSIRSGKTVCMTVGFILWSMATFNGERFALCGKTIESLRRNVVLNLRDWVPPELTIVERRSENKLIISDGLGRENTYFLFGGRDESSYMLIQGITLAGALLDEVVLMPRSFVEQALARCSIKGSKIWFNCNPESPMHWFLKNWIEKKEEKRMLHLHFTMDDNPSLSEDVRERYKTTYSGVFYKRFILGLWVMAQGAIYKDAWSDDLYFDKNQLEYIYNNPRLYRRYISIDYGTVNPMCFLDIWDDGDIAWVVREYYWNSREEGKHEKDNSQYGDDLMEFINSVDYAPSAVIIDPSAASFKIEMRNRGLRAKETVDTINADNSVLEGIRTVNKMLTKKKIRIYKENCPMLVKEMQSYAWDEKAIQNGGREKPIKVNDHSVDALRYYCQTVIRSRRLANA
nr:MAG TPA: large terminase [Caudoviricetes sp.]